MSATVKISDPRKAPETAPFQELPGRAFPAGLATPAGPLTPHLVLGTRAPTASPQAPSPGPWGPPSAQGQPLPSASGAKARTSAADAGLCLARGGSAGRLRASRDAAKPVACPSSLLCPHVTPGDDDEPQASRATSTRPLCPNSDPKDHRAPSRSFPPCSSSLREDPQVLGEELAGPRAAGRPERPRRPCPAASWGAEPSPSFPDPRKE